MITLFSVLRGNFRFSVLRTEFGFSILGGYLKTLRFTLCIVIILLVIIKFICIVCVVIRSVLLNWSIVIIVHHVFVKVFSACIHYFLLNHWKFITYLLVWSHLIRGCIYWTYRLLIISELIGLANNFEILIKSFQTQIVYFHIWLDISFRLRLGDFLILLK